MPHALVPPAAFARMGIMGEYDTEGREDVVTRGTCRFKLPITRAQAQRNTRYPVKYQLTH